MHAFCREIPDFLAHYKYEFDDDYHETDRNLARDILATISIAFGFCASSQLSRNHPGCGESWRYYYFQEVAAARWFKRQTWSSLYRPENSWLALWMSIFLELVIEMLPFHTLNLWWMPETRKANEYAGKGASGRLTKNNFHLQCLLLFPYFARQNCVRALDTDHHQLLVHRLSSAVLNTSNKIHYMHRATS